MAQQINLCTPILLTQKRYFSAHTMTVALGVFAVLGVLLFGVWVWNLDKGREAFAQTGMSQARELENLKAAMERSRASAAPVDPALLAQLQAQRNLLAQREKLREALKEGMFRPGWGHSDRLTWVARSIPAPVWVTEIKMDGSRFEVSGFTLEPSALNDWVDQLGSSPLMQGLRLSTVKVEHAVGAAGARTSATSASMPAAAPRPIWSFNLVSVEPVPASPASSAPGSKP
jgi:Tfp pilus assembly protein PilN